MTPHVMITIWPDKSPGTSKHGGFCKGMYELCKQVEKTGSIRQATKRIGMAYSKAWMLINAVEADFGCTLIERQSGPYGSKLSKKCKRIMKKYEEVRNVYNRPTK